MMKEQLKSTIEYCAANNFDDVLLILSNEIDVFNELIENQDILNLAVKFKSIDVVKILLSMGADARTDNSQLLCQAVADDKYKIAELLIKYGADVETDYNDPLRIALNMRNHRMSKLLIKKGANVNAALDAALKLDTALDAALKYCA